MAAAVIGLIRRMLQKGPRVVAYRGWQVGSLSLRRRVRYWPTLQRRISAFWNPNRIFSWMNVARSNRLLIGPANLVAFRSWSAEHPEQTASAREWAASIASGRIDIFDQEHQFDWDHIQWHTDWRWQQTWEPAYYKSYSFYVSDKDRPFDVKFPWELSRLSFLLPLAQLGVLDGEPRWLDHITRVVTDWERANPVAYSVNWNPMECSIRAVNLMFVLQMLGADDKTRPEHVAPLLRLLTLHGEFLYRNIEYTNVRGNHYTANLVALLLMGQTLQGIYKPARSWLRHASKRMCHEIGLQYCDDGVNFEKSTAYHRLVTELFLVGLIVLEHEGLPISSAAHQRIHQACVYTHSYLRPDGLAPNWGDNDSARILGFDRRPTRDHRPLLDLAAAYFGDARLRSIPGDPSASILWLLGSRGLQRWDAPPSLDAGPPTSRLFEAGGMAVTCHDGSYLFADFGEVGQYGLGGHGHNDTFSFELAFAGRSIVVDSGSPVYTGDLDMYNLYRGTQAHNGLRVDGQEIARLLGTWRISNEARPFKVSFHSGDDSDILQGEHYGYHRLNDPVTHRRTLIFDKRQRKLICRDLLQCNGSHNVERFLHFPSGLQVELLQDSTVVLHLTGSRVVIRWEPDVQSRLEQFHLSENYGSRTPSQMLILEQQILGTIELSFEITFEMLEYT